MTAEKKDLFCKYLHLEKRIKYCQKALSRSLTGYSHVTTLRYIAQVSEKHFYHNCTWNCDLTYGVFDFFFFFFKRKMLQTFLIGNKRKKSKRRLDFLRIQLSALSTIECKSQSYFVEIFTNIPFILQNTVIQTQLVRFNMTNMMQKLKRNY